MSTNGKKRASTGPRPHAGRPKKVNPDAYVQITCVLRRDTVEKLRAGAGGKQKFFGSFLQFHLDRFPIPSHQEYLAMKQKQPLEKVLGPKHRKTPVIFGGNIGAARRPRIRPGLELDEVRARFLKEFKPV